MPHAEFTASVPSVSSVEELEELLSEAKQSGEPIEMTPAEWQRLHDDIEQDALLRRKAS